MEVVGSVGRKMAPDCRLAAPGSLPPQLHDPDTNFLALKAVHPFLPGSCSVMGSACQGAENQISRQKRWKTRSF